jgi:hypothetical protein
VEYLQAAITNIIRAASESDANALIDEAIAFCDANGMPEIEEVYTAKWEANCATQGGSIYTR